MNWPSLTHEQRARRKRARQIATLARHQRKLVRAPHCEECGDRTKTEAHHPDYTRPLQIVWLCNSCHNDVHRPDEKMKRIAPWISNAQWERLRRMAFEERRSMSEIVREAIDAHLSAAEEVAVTDPLIGESSS